MRTDRLVSIIMILLDKKRISAKELADTFEVSPRTIYRDIDAINLSGIPIHSTSGVGGGFEIMEKYKLDKNVFSNDDLSTLMLGISSLTNIMADSEVVHTLTKIKNLIPNERLTEIELKSSQLQIDLSSWIGNRNIQPYLKIIKGGLDEFKIITFEYLDAHGNKTVRSAEPYQIVLKNSHWYWQGYCLNREDYRLFKISRMSNVSTSNNYFAPREYQKPQLDFSDNLSALQTKIKLRIHKSVMDSALEFCPYEDFIENGNEHYIVELPFVEKDYYYNIILGFGDKCECLEPQYIREEIKKRILDMARVYE